MSDVNGFSTIPAKILLPIDFSPSSHEAIEQASVLAQHFHAELFLVHIVQESASVETEKHEAEKRFVTSVESLAAKGIKSSYCVGIDEDIASAIIEVADEQKVDMVVLSTHGTTGWHPLVFGSIASKLIKLVQVPLLLLRSHAPESSIEIKNGRLMEWW